MKKRGIKVQARWDCEAGVWLAASRDVPGLIIEAKTLPAAIKEMRLVLPELLKLSSI